MQILEIDLVSKKDYSEVYFSVVTWSFYLKLAERYGWEYQGKKKLKGYDFADIFDLMGHTKTAKTVKKKDAVNLGNALKAAMAADDLERVVKQVADEIATDIEQEWEEEPPDFRKALTFDGEIAGEFIEFCLKGQFSIE